MTFRVSHSLEEHEVKRSAHASNVCLFYRKISRLCFDNVVVVIVEHALVIISTITMEVA